MKYGNEMGMCGDTELTVAAPQENLAERMHSAAGLGRVVQEMAGRIRGGLFGCGAQMCEKKEKAPECLEEELERHREDLAETARILDEICARLGV